MALRNGQWVLVPVGLLSATDRLHVVGDQAVGIHVSSLVEVTRGGKRVLVQAGGGPAGVRPTDTDVTPTDLAEVHLVDGKGETAFIGPLPTAALKAVTARELVPAPRLARMDPTWTPQP